MFQSPSFPRRESNSVSPSIRRTATDDGRVRALIWWTGMQANLRHVIWQHHPGPKQRSSPGSEGGTRGKHKGWHRGGTAKHQCARTEKKINHSTIEQAPLGIEPNMKYQPPVHTDYLRSSSINLILELFLGLNGLVFPQIARMA